MRSFSFIPAALSILILALTSETASARPSKYNHFFSNGFNTPVFGEFALGYSTDTSNAEWRIKAGIQFVRWADYLSITAGMMAMRATSSAYPRHYGPSLEFIVIPDSPLHGSLFISRLYGGIDGYAYTNVDGEANTGWVSYDGYALGVSLLYTVAQDMKVSLGLEFGLGNEVTSNSDSRTNQALSDHGGVPADASGLVPGGGIAIFLGFRGSLI